MTENTITTETSPCECFSCDHQCGGTQDPDSCGPLADVDGQPICEACREKADVFDDHRTGAQATISQQRVRLEVDTFGWGKSIWLDAASARHLAAVLERRAAELEG